MLFKLHIIRSKIPLLPEQEDMFTNIIFSSIACGAEQNCSGIVFAGFGEKEIYPSLYRYKVASVFHGHCIKKNVKKCDAGKTTEILPLAQNEDIHSFISGIAPKLEFFFKDALSNMMKELQKQIKELGEQQINETFKEETFSKIEKICKGAYENLWNNFKEQQKNEFINPILETTSLLNKEELANMAETLVNLVSFRKQVTCTTETVGGPIDVAVITKGDGFIWIKRKHYFEPALNHHFFDNYYVN